MRLTLRRSAILAVVLVVLLAFALGYVAFGGGGGPNYVPAPTIACLRAGGFAISWESPPYRFRQARGWASIEISRHGHGLSATFAPSPALARETAPTSGFSTADPWIRRNVVFSNRAGPEDGPIVGCLRGPRRH